MSSDNKKVIVDEVKLHEEEDSYTMVIMAALMKCMRQLGIDHVPLSIDDASIIYENNIGIVINAETEECVVYTVKKGHAVPGFQDSGIKKEFN